MKKIAIITLGCKTNQYESQAVGEKLEQLGHQVVYNFEKADIYILNTCAVTNEAERKSRQTISKFVKLNPACKIFVCGCASQNNPQQFKDLPNVQYVIGNANMMTLVNKISVRKGSAVAKLPENYDENVRINKITKARAYVKIQDGCNRFCSYCLIPYLRGRSRSRNMFEILQEIATLKNAGAKEIVLTGIDLSDFKIDDNLALLELLQQIDTFGVRFRLGSLEPNLLTEEFLQNLQELHNFCPHFHISMQSGCTQTLERMNRHYTAEFFVERTNLVKKYFPNGAITTDLIVGFPDESDAEFAKTLKTIKKISFAQMHIFPFSRRSGTTADKLLSMKGKEKLTLVPTEVVKERMKTVLALAKKLEKKYLKAQHNKILQAVIEELHNGFLVGTTQNYVKVYIPCTNKRLVGELVSVKIGKIFEDGVLASLI